MNQFVYSSVMMHPHDFALLWSLDRIKQPLYKHWRMFYSQPRDENDEIVVISDIH